MYKIFTFRPTIDIHFACIPDVNSQKITFKYYTARSLRCMYILYLQTYNCTRMYLNCTLA